MEDRKDPVENIKMEERKDPVETTNMETAETVEERGLTRMIEEAKEDRVILEKTKSWTIERIDEQKQKRSEYLLQSASSCSGRLHKKIKNCERLIRRYKLDIENFNRDLKCNQRKIAIAEHGRTCTNDMANESATTIRLARFNYVGFPESGKTTTLQRLTDKIVNIEEERGGKSADAAKPRKTVAKRQNSLIMQNPSPASTWKWFHKSIDDCVFIMNCIASKDTGNEECWPNMLLCDALKELQSPLVDELVRDYEKVKNCQDIEKAVRSGNEANVEYFEDATAMINTDTGGQTELRELFYQFIMVSAINMVFFKLTHPLHEPYSTYMDNPLSGEHTNNDVLFQLLSSVVYSQKFKESTCSLSSKIIFIGTFKDEVNEADIEMRDKALKEKMKSTNYYKEHVIYSNDKDKKLIFPLDNLRGLKSEIEELRSKLEEIMVEEFDKVHFPVKWLVLNYHLNKHDYLSFEECLTRVKSLNMDDVGLKNALYQLQGQVGSILYYEHLSLICKPEVLFDAITKLLNHVFNASFIGRAVVDDFEEKGMFKESDLKKAIERSGQVFAIPIEKMLELLRFHNALVKIPLSSDDQEDDYNEDTHHEDDSEISSSATYFMPYKLKAATKTDMRLSQGNTEPLLIYFKRGYVPLGVFCSLILCIISHSTNEKPSWELVKSSNKLFQNMITFRVGCDCDSVTLINRLKYIEIRVVRDIPDPIWSTSTLCTYIHKFIDYSMSETIRKIQKMSSGNFLFGFHCSHPGDDHISVLGWLANGESTVMRCLCNPDDRKAYKLEPRHKVWLQKENKLLFNLQSLNLIKWTEVENDNRTERRLQIISELSPDWEKIGDHLEIHNSVLESLKDELRDNEKRCRKVFTIWINHGCLRYEANWKGFIELLYDLPRSTLVETLQKALDSFYICS